MRGQRQFRQLEIGGIRVLIDEKRIVQFTEEAGMLARCDRTVADDVRIRNVRSARRAQLGRTVDDRAKGGESFERIAQPLIVGRRREPGQAE